MVTTEAHGDVALIRLDDGKANVLNPNSLAALMQAFDATVEAKAIVLAGSDKCFCGGLDLKMLPKLPPDELKAALILFGDYCVRVLTHPRPVIAAVNGHAIAGGAVLLLCCDLRVGADKEAKIGLNEVAIGMPMPTFVYELGRQVMPTQKLRETILHGRLYAPAQACEVGFLDELARPDQLEASAIARAQALAQLPDPAYRLTKHRMTAKFKDALGILEEEMNFFFTSQAQAHASRFG